MRRLLHRITLPAVLTAVLLTGCSVAEAATTSSGTPAVAVAEVDATAADTTVQAELDGNHDWVSSDTSVDTTSATTVTLAGTTATVDGEGASVDGGTVTVTAAGTYVLTGTLTDGQVVVDTADTDQVTIVLDGADLTSSTTSPLQVTAAEEVVVLLADGSTNSLTDATTYVDADEEDAPNAALFSAGDLTIAGTGSLTVTGRSNDGIASKDDLVIVSGTISVTAVDDGLRGKDALVVLGGDVTVDAGGDGLKSDADDDATRGYVYVADGTLAVTAGDDGLDATTDVLVGGGTLRVVAGGGTNAAEDVTDDVSPKGLVAGVSLVVGGGQVLVDSADDALHSDGNLTVTDGDVQVSAGDDALHAELGLTISGGSLEVVASYEGIEAEVVTISGGDVSVVSSDDAINGSSSTATESMAAVEGVSVTISGGTVVLDADGDGLDSNGDLTISGGTVVVNGPEDDGNGALDVDGAFTMSGGVLLAAGSSGMAQTPSADSAQSFVSLTSAQTIAAGTVLQVLDADGDVVATFETSKQIANVIYSSADVVSGETYQLAVGGTASGTSTGGLAESGDATGATVQVTGTAGVESAGMGGPGGGAAGGAPAGGGPAGGGQRP